MTKVSKASIVVLMAIVLAVGLGGSAVLCKETEFVVFGTASVGGAYYPLGVAMATVVNESVPGIRASAQVTGGARANMDLLDKGEIQIGFESGGQGPAAALGESPFDHKYPIKMMFQFSPSPYQIVTLERTGIKTIGDLKGRRLAIVPADSGTGQTICDILDAHGITKDMFKPQYLGYDQSVEALIDGLIDALAISAAVPSPALDRIQERHKPVLIGVDVSVMEQSLQKDARFRLFRLITLPAETYKWQKEPVTLLTANARAWARADMAEETVYQIMKAIFSNKDRIAQAHPGGKVLELFTKEEVMRYGVELHPGAVQYARETGAW